MSEIKTEKTIELEEYDSEYGRSKIELKKGQIELKLIDYIMLPSANFFKFSIKPITDEVIIKHTIKSIYVNNIKTEEFIYIYNKDYGWFHKWI